MAKKNRLRLIKKEATQKKIKSISWLVLLPLQNILSIHFLIHKKKIFMLPSTHKKIHIQFRTIATERQTVKKYSLGLVCCCYCWCFFQDEHTKKIDFFQQKKIFFMAFGSKCCLSMALKSSFVESIASLRTWRNFSSFFIVLSIFWCYCGREKGEKLHRKEKIFCWWFFIDNCMFGWLQLSYRLLSVQSCT